VKPLFWFSKRQEQEPEETLPGSSPFQIRTAKPQDLSSIAQILADSFHSRAGISGWFYPLFRLGIYEDLRLRLQSNSPRYVCLVGVYQAPTVRDGESFSGLRVEVKELLLPKSGVSRSHQQHNEAQKDFLAGTVEMTLRPSYPWRIYGSSQYPYLSNLAVRPECRRQGVARELLLSCEQIALDWGFQDLYLHVLENNQKARGLYTKLGYRLDQVDSSWGCFLWKQPRQLLLHKRLTANK